MVSYISSTIQGNVMSSSMYCQYQRFPGRVSFHLPLIYFEFRLFCSGSILKADESILYVSCACHGHVSTMIYMNIEHVLFCPCLVSGCACEDHQQGEGGRRLLLGLLQDRLATLSGKPSKNIVQQTEFGGFDCFLLQIYAGEGDRLGQKLYFLSSRG